MAQGDSSTLPSHMGHRSRLKERFQNTGPESLADYELLEMLLFYAQPRGDTKPTAKALLSTFNSFSNLLHGTDLALTGIQGIGTNALNLIKLIRQIYHRMEQEKVLEKPLFSNSFDVIQYLKSVMSHLTHEQLRVLYLDTKHHLLKDEVQQVGTINQTAIYPREVVKRALELGAASFILVHNHPSGDPTPSGEDLSLTMQVKDAAKTLGISLIDHLIIGKGRYTSLKEMGVL